MKPNDTNVLAILRVLPYTRPIGPELLQALSEKFKVSPEGLKTLMEIASHTGGIICSEN